MSLERKRMTPFLSIVPHDVSIVLLSSKLGLRNRRSIVHIVCKVKREMLFGRAFGFLGCQNRSPACQGGLLTRATVHVDENFH
jgi:hypothetical protein